MTIRSLSRRLQRLEGTPKSRPWIVDMKRFPDRNREEAVIAFGNGQMPDSQDVVLFSDEIERDDPLTIMQYGDLHIFGDPAELTVGR